MRHRPRIKRRSVALSKVARGYEKDELDSIEKEYATAVANSDLISAEHALADLEGVVRGRPSDDVPLDFGAS
jgi:hypothetical protein